jgi:hypothetical protein
VAPDVPPNRQDSVAQAVSIVLTSPHFSLGQSGELLPGRYVMRVDLGDRLGRRHWMVDSATINGRDVLDEPFDVTPSESAVLHVVLSEQGAALLGRLELGDSRPATEFVIIAFPTNRAWWRSPFRRIRGSRPGTDGHFEINNLPPGDYYLAALTEVAPDEWLEAAFLSDVVPSAVRVTLRPGEALIKNLRVAR